MKVNVAPASQADIEVTSNESKWQTDWAKGTVLDSDWDLICGPVANDQTMPVIDLYLDGMYDEEETVTRLLPQKLKDQYSFKTEKAISLLRFKEVITP